MTEPTVAELQLQLANAFELYYESMKDCGLGREDVAILWQEQLAYAPLAHPERIDYDVSESMDIHGLAKELAWLRTRVYDLAYISQRLRNHDNSYTIIADGLMHAVKELVGSVEAAAHQASNTSLNRTIKDGNRIPLRTAAPAPARARPPGAREEGGSA